jgi:polysaccharide deacetylase family protein (PEP-CTERM system associated)
MDNPVLMISFDIEDWFHCENFKAVLPREKWTEMEPRVERNTHIILDMLARYDCLATFFILGWVAERHPGLVKTISSLGHEIASHGYNHGIVYRQSPPEFREDIRKTKALLEDAAGVKVRGYRAPTFSIVDWAFEVLYEEGYEYDSSLFPVTFHDRYGSLQDVKISGITLLDSGIKEVPLPIFSFASLKIPWAGGGYFRLLPYKIYSQGLKKIVKTDDHFVFYFHPHELDSDQPEVKGLGTLTRFRQRVGISTAKDKLEALLTDFRFTPIAERLRLLAHN